MYKLNDGPQSSDFGCSLLNDRSDIDAGESGKEWSVEELQQLGFLEDGDRTLIESILSFTCLLLEHCGNRSIYASSSHLNDLLNSTSLSVLIATLEVGSELAQRYQASVKRIGHASRHISAALLANHYNIDIERVQQIAHVFIKTPIISLADPAPSVTPASGSKGKEKVQAVRSKDAVATHANDLVSLATSNAESWNGWGDIKVFYYPQETAAAPEASVEKGSASLPSTPTPLRRSTTVGAPQQTPKNRNAGGDDSSPIWPRTPGVADDHGSSGQKSFELPQSVVLAHPVHELMERCPQDMPSAAKYELFHRLRVARALLGDVTSRQQILASRLLATTNLAYIHNESNFVEKVLRNDMDEARRYQLVYQLADLIHPSTEQEVEVPLWLQTISLALLEAISGFHARCQDVLSALNANVNHGVLLYVIRKAVAGMEDDEAGDDGNQVNEKDDWRNNLFSLTLNICMATRIGSEMASAGLMEILVQILNMRTKIAQRHHSMVLAFLDGLIWAFPNAFSAFFNADGLDAVSKLVVDTVAEAETLLQQNKGIALSQQSSAVDYTVPYYQQQTLKWLLKFVHRIMSNTYSYNGNTDRMLRNLSEKSDLLAGLRHIIRDKRSFGSVVWTNCVMILSDFINNDPTSFAAISESGMISTYLEAVTGHELPVVKADETKSGDPGDDEESDSADSSAINAMIEQDERPHPPTEEALRATERPGELATGVLASSDAINAIPQVLNSICLNKLGMKMVVASRAFDSFFEVFESARHVKCMEADGDLAGTVGGNFDELARHHPPLRTAISNSVIDMVARVRLFAIRKAEVERWGAKLLLNSESGTVVSVTADGHIEEVGEDNSSSTRASGDGDVQMSDSSTVQKPDSPEKQTESHVDSPYDSVSPYVFALATFLSAYLSNSVLKANFIEKGGLELLLDICESPSLPATYGDSPASRVMASVVSLLIEHSPVRGLPSLLKRAQSSINDLQPLADKTEALPPIFGPFLSADLKVSSTTVSDTLRSGNTMVKSLLNAQTFIKIISDCFAATRANSIQFFPVNVYDYYLALVKSIGPLMRGVLAEEAGELSLVPQKWSLRNRDASGDVSRQENTANRNGEESSLPDVMTSTGSWRATDDTNGESHPTDEERATPRYRNYEILKMLLHPMIPTSFPFFQSLGKALIPRREQLHGDPFPRPRHLEIAKALADTVLDQLAPSVATPNPTSKEFHYWIITLHTIHEMLIDHPTGRQSDRSNIQILMPVLLAFKEQGGLDVLNDMLQAFVNAVKTGTKTSPEETSNSKVAAFGLKKVLDLYAILANGKYITETSNHFNLQRQMERSQTVPHVFQQIVVDFRAAIMPKMLLLWNSDFFEHVPVQTIKRLVDILKLIASSENEPPSPSKDRASFYLLKYTDARFSWRNARSVVHEIMNAGYDESLAYEATYRANGNSNMAREYCRAHKAGLAGPPNPIPLQDIDKLAVSSQNNDTEASGNNATSEADRMSIDAVTDAGSELTGEQPPAVARTNSSGSLSSESEHSDSGASNAQRAEDDSSSQAELDSMRVQLRDNLIDQCLDAIRAHPECAIEVSELINTVILRSQNHEAQEDVGATLTFALSSLALDEDERKRNGKCIAAYSHLLALLLQDESFFANNIDTLRDKSEEYLTFLKVPSGSGDEMPPWIPYILLILEIFLCHDERPVPAQWKPPKSIDEEVAVPVVQLETSMVDDEQRATMLECLLDLLPRIGKDELLATSILRILVILTRKRQLSKHVGEKRNLQRLFLMAKQLSGFGSERLKQNRLTAYIITILRHIMEDEDTIKQVMRAEIKAEYPILTRSNRGHPDVTNFLRALAPVALRAPELFVQVTNELMRFSRWSADGSRPNSLMLKEGLDVAANDDQIAPKSVNDASRVATEDVKPSTEISDKEMVDAPKPSESKRPVVENPDAVVHFLLCELVNYREVDDKEPVPPTKDAKLSTETSAPDSSEGVSSNDSVDDNKDKKQTKPVFKAEEHPIFVYRCFLLNCLTELLQSYTRAKVEFINFKRSAPPLSSNTPIKPRTGILNYLIYDLLCQSNLAGTADTIIAKKKAATSVQTQKVLVALVSRASEKTPGRSQSKFEYDDDADLLFVRKFVLDTILRAYEKAPISDEPFETRYSRMQCLAELMNHMVGEKDKEQRPQDRFTEVTLAQSQAQLRRLMYEKGYLDKLTASIAEINLNYPGVKRAIKYVLRVLRILTDTAKELSHSNLLKSEPQGEASDEEFDSASSLSDLDDDREETPDLYRNSALGMLEPRDEDDDYDDEDEDEEGMYGDEYDEEMDYGDEDMSDGEDAISDDDEEEFGEMGQIEGLHGEPGVVEVIMDDDDDDDDEDDSDDDEDDSADMEDIDDRVEIVDEDGHPIEDDSAWESDSDIEEVIEPEVDDLEYEGEMPGEHEGGIDMGADDLIGNMARAIMGDDEYDGDLMGGLDEHYLDDDDHDDDEEDDEEEIEDDEYLDEHFPQDHVPTLPSLGWDGLNADHDERNRQLFLLEGQRRPVFTRMEHRGGFPSRFIGGAHRDPNGDFRNYFARNHRGGAQQPPNDDGLNPLLRRTDVTSEGTTRPGHHNTFGFRLPEGLLGGSGRHVIDGPMGFLGELMEFLPMMGRNGQNPSPSFHVHISGPGGAQAAFPLRASRGDQRRDASQEPHQAVAFSAESTIHRYQEEARMLFGANHTVEALKLTNAVNAELTPAGIELEKKLRITEEQNRKRLEEVRKKKEEEERLAREAKEAEEKEAREQKEAEERAAAERAAAEAASQEANEVTDQAGIKDDDSAMEGVEASEANQSTAADPDAPRIMTTLRGSEYDITDLGIDPDYLAALPEEFREEVIAQTLTERRSQAREEATTAGESTEVFQEFLDALPEELRVEIAQQEQQEQRRRHRDESRRQAAASASADQAAIPTEMDTASILLTFPPELREQVLLEQGQDLMDQLPPDMAAHARALAQQHSPMPVQRPARSMPPPGVVQSGAQTVDADKTPESKPQRKTVVQMLDKAGVATLLRLMFIAQQGSIRNYLFGVFADVCENRQNRLEVISTVLQILQEGTTDMPAVERSFGQLSIKARRHKEKDAEPRTPQNLKRTLTALTITNNAQTNSETSPLLIAQQCLDLLVDLCARNPHIAWVFLTEHDIVGATIRKVLNRKGKSKDSKAQKYAINALLTLLDRELVTESSVVMTHLADLLNRVTMPLQNLERRRKESKSEEENVVKPSHGQTSEPTEPNAAAAPNSGAAEQSEAGKPDASAEEQGAAQKRTRQLQPPLIPEESLVLVVRIFVARECSSKTFQNTIATIKNLCAIPGTKTIFGQELIRQARLLSENIVSDLDDLLPHITEASSGTDIQGVALSKFSPGASEQNKLLRVLTALDHLFDTKKKNGDTAADQASESEREDLLISLYHNSTFSAMWEKLSACLRAIRQRENMLNVATILLPLIESLMVVCKNTTSKEDLSQSKELTISSPQPESQTASLFYSFTEEHRRILNELVRHSPKLMSGTFALLVKNPKVLEFDNKRNYFNRSVHSRAGQNHGRQSYPSLQLSIRRDHVFHDSYKSLYFKSGDEVKFGKLSIRFHGEEGVDAGGVTREWFQVLARQMFDPNYVLFTPVSSDRTTFHPNKLSGVNEEHLSFFKFIGRIIGKALYEGRLLDCFFSRAVYKRILGKAVSVKDMESFDPDYYKSLCWMLDNDITDIITETFSVEDEEFGVAKVVDLKPNGRDIAVTEENKHEYVRLMVDHKLLSSVKEQMESFLTGMLNESPFFAISYRTNGNTGFHEIIPAELISIFNEQELELLISGLPDIDIDDWRGNTEYQNYSPSSPQIQWFWRAVRSFDKEELAKLLQFVTGTSKVPLNGFKELEGMNGVSRFNIHRDYGNKDRLPTSHTCFNRTFT